MVAFLTSPLRSRLGRGPAEAARSLRAGPTIIIIIIIIVTIIIIIVSIITIIIINISIITMIIVIIIGAEDAERAPRDTAHGGLKTATNMGLSYLSNATCLIRPHLFSTALLV